MLGVLISLCIKCMYEASWKQRQGKHGSVMRQWMKKASDGVCLCVLKHKLFRCSRYVS